MQVMHALVGCQKRWINSLRRRFHSLDMIPALVAADTAIELIRAASRRSGEHSHGARIDVLNTHAVTAGQAPGPACDTTLPAVGRGSKLGARSAFDHALCPDHNFFFTLAQHILDCQRGAKAR
jgi:hypothetical protein